MVNSHVITDGGLLAKVYAIDAGGQHPIHGCYYAGDGEWHVACWTASGYRLKAETPHPLDIVGEIQNGSITVQEEGAQETS